MPELVSAEAIGALLGVSGQAVRKAHAAGRLSSINGKFDPAVARIQWEANRKRRPARPGASSPESAAADGPRAPSPSGEGSDYWDAKTRREAAEASIAELKEAELRGDLVRRDRVERELAARLVALRESFEVLADRLAPVIAAEFDAQACRRMLRDEHRAALGSFTETLEVVGTQEGLDGSA